MNDSQLYQILNCLLCKGKLTALEGMRYFGTMNLRSRIAELKNDYGFPIQSEFVKVHNRNGKVVYVKSYHL
jgi:hypothetical protein